MPINEALNRGPMERLRTSHDILERLPTEEAILKKADRLLEQSHVRQVLGELREIIGSDFPDAQISRRVVLADGSVTTSLQWDFRSSPKGGRPMEPNHNRLSIYVFPSTGEIAISREILTEGQWVDRAIVEDAVAAAFKNPERWTGPDLKSYIRIAS